MSRPLVSVMMPCFNGRKTLPWALGSVLTQTLEDWELVLVDDGSTDHPHEVVEHVSDPRIHYIRLPENRGRSVARQIALEAATGHYLAMLDADDWMYPWRLSVQVGVLTEYPEISLVSAGLAITDSQHQIVGMRGMGEGKVLGPHVGLDCPVLHASSMYRRDLVGDETFDPGMLLGQDRDFLGRILRGKYYLIMRDLLYAYSELESVTAIKAARAQKYSRRKFRRYIRQAPLEAISAISLSLVKEALYRGISLAKMDKVMVQRRAIPPEENDVAEYSLARAIVQQKVHETFGSIESVPVSAGSTGER